MIKKRRNRIFLYAGFAIAALAVFIGWNLFGPTVKEPASKYLFIKTGSSYQAVSDSLVKNNILSTTFWFKKVAGAMDYNDNIKPGRYRVTEGMSVIGLIGDLRSGKQTPVNLVITKLRTKEDLAFRIGNNFEADPDEVQRFLDNPDSLSNFGLDTNTVMTAIIPNTYSINWNTSTHRIFRKLHSEQEKFWNDERKKKAARLGLSEKKIYIIASIVEEETNEPGDKGKIASVYLNRLRTGMKLGADPTVKFAMKDFGLKRILFKHLKFASPYNTYMVNGLPPGPICTPSIKTIDAVLDCPETDYLYFVARSDFSGYSNFASNYQQHLLYAKEYQKALDSLIMKKSGQ